MGKSNAERDCYKLIQAIALARDPICIIPGCWRPSDCGHHLFGRHLAAAFNPEMVRGVCNGHPGRHDTETKPIRVGKQFESGKKLGKTHQNILIFKG
jgi:hypothetical protein